MYVKWAEKLGYKGRLVEKHTSMHGGIESATIEFEFECAYGYLSGERGIHHKINSQNGSVHHEVSHPNCSHLPKFKKRTTCISLKIILLIFQFLIRINHFF
jgi:protein subunit release factor B